MNQKYPQFNNFRMLSHNAFSTDFFDESKQEVEPKEREKKFNELRKWNPVAKRK